MLRSKRQEDSLSTTYPEHCQFRDCQPLKTTTNEDLEPCMNCLNDMNPGLLEKNARSSNIDRSPPLHPANFSPDEDLNPVIHPSSTNSIIDDVPGTSCTIQCSNIARRTINREIQDIDNISEICSQHCCQSMDEVSSEELDQPRGFYNNQDVIHDGDIRPDREVRFLDNRRIEQNLLDATNVQWKNKCITQFIDNLISTSRQNEEFISQGDNPSLTLIRAKRAGNSNLKFTQQLYNKRWGNPSLKLAQQMISKRWGNPYLKLSQQMHPKRWGNPSLKLSQKQMHLKRWGNPSLKLSKQMHTKRWGNPILKLNQQIRQKRFGNASLKLSQQMHTKRWGNPSLKLSQQMHPKRWGNPGLKLSPNMNGKLEGHPNYKSFIQMLTNQPSPRLTNTLQLPLQHASRSPNNLTSGSRALNQPQIYRENI